MLTPYVPFDPTESVMGFAARLGDLHTGGRTGPFLRDIGVKLGDLARGQTGAVQKLADIAGVTPEAMIANAPRGIDRTHFDVRGEGVSAEFLSSPHTVFCPACLLADDQASGGRTGFRRHRWIWQLKVVRTCPEHGLPLMRRKASFSGDRFHELAIMVPESQPAWWTQRMSLPPSLLSGHSEVGLLRAREGRSRPSSRRVSPIQSSS